MPFLGSKKVKESLEMKLRINNSITTNQLHMAESMGDYFSSIADNIGSANDAMDYNVLNHESIQAIVNHRMAVGDDRSFNFEGLRLSDVVKILKDIDPKKATGWDTIPPKAFKMGSTVLAAPLCDLYNRCIKSCHWPKNWKRGEWVPIHKKNHDGTMMLCTCVMTMNASEPTRTCCLFLSALFNSNKKF